MGRIAQGPCGKVCQLLALSHTDFAHQNDETGSRFSAVEFKSVNIENETISQPELGRARTCTEMLGGIICLVTRKKRP